MLTWHAERASTKSNTERWESMRTFYVLTRDFKTFTKAASLDQPGPWREVPLKYEGVIRHGCVIRINEGVYRGLLAADKASPGAAARTDGRTPHN